MTGFHKTSAEVSWTLLLAVGLAAAPTACSAMDRPRGADSIQNIDWEWSSLKDQSSGETMAIPEPGEYTIIFHADGTVSGIADCNAFGGSYTQDGGLTIELGPMTSVACPAGSLDRQYLQLLSEVAAGGPDGAGGLALETAGGAQRLEFRAGRPVPNP